MMGVGAVQRMYLMLVLVMMVLLGGQLWWCDGCLEEERIALLQIKDRFGYLNGSSPQQLRSWREDVDCCSWVGVSCNATTRRVTKLGLSHIRDGELGDGYLNASLFIPFKQLNYLNLMGNGIAGCAENEGFERLSKLANLEFLDLSYNNFSSSILPSLAALSSLKSLNLDSNRLKGSINIQELMQQLGSLEYLGLGYNEIEGFKSVHAGEPLVEFSNLKDLGLRYNKLKGLVNLKEPDLFSNLEKLDLSGNDINEFVVSRRGLSNLSVLYLNNITIYGRSIQLLQQSLVAFPNLRTLDLGENNFKQTIFGEGLHNLSCSIEELRLDFSSFDENALQSLAAIPSLRYLSMWHHNGTLPSQGLPNLLNLESLDLSGSAVNNNLLQVIGRTPALKTLILNSCELNGTIPTVKGLCELKHLQELDVSFNALSGTLPPCLANLTFLQSLGLSGNDFSGDISLSPLRSLTSIQNLDLSSNHFKIPISLSPFFNHSALKSLDCRHNDIFADEEEVSNLAPKFRLEFLDLNGHGYGGTFPKFLYHQHNLQSVDLSNIKMEGVLFPNWLLENNTNLGYLSLANNSFLGFFRLPTRPHINLSFLNISNNHFHGHLPTEIGAYLPRLYFLSMSNNGFDGSIPSSFSNMSMLEDLDLSNNNLSGEIPMHLAMGCSSLEALILSKNKLEGQIFSTNIGLKVLSWLQLDGNLFIGGIPGNLFNCSALMMLDISDNNLSGGIPEWMRNLSSLEYLDLSRNNFSGSLPNSLSPSQLQYVYLSRNRLQGLWTNAFYDCSNLVVLDLGHNCLTGIIPKWINRLSLLTFLLLNHNNFKGEIPVQLCELDQLSLIDFSHNSLSGHIPACLRFNNGDLRKRQEGLSSYGFFFRDDSTESLTQSLEFTVKSSSLSYQGSILEYISGVDFSCNNFIGKIPFEIGYLTNINALNLSHNNLIGLIPPTFANLREIESLDLSYNKLNGKIPPQLIELHFLAVFSVAHNNLSGKLPDRVAQFATFDVSSYKYNPFLCGLPLPKSCNAAISPLPLPGISTNEEDDGFMDMNVFYVTFVLTYIMVLMGIAAVLCINPNWRRAWFYFIEVSINNCYYFLVDNLCILPKFRF